MLLMFLDKEFELKCKGRQLLAWAGKGHKQYRMCQGTVYLHAGLVSSSNHPALLHADSAAGLEFWITGQFTGHDRSISKKVAEKPTVSGPFCDHPMCHQTCPENPPFLH